MYLREYSIFNYRDLILPSSSASLACLCFRGYANSVSWLIWESVHKNDQNICKKSCNPTINDFVMWFFDMRKLLKILLSQPLDDSMLSWDHVPWNFRTQNSRSKNVFSKSFNPKSSWILINPESFPRCRLQRNRKKGTKGISFRPLRILNAQNSNFWTHGNF